MKQWNDTIMADAQKWQAMDPVPYVIDGGLNKSGVLDVARQVKQRIKAFAYAYRVTGQTMWVDRAWKELYVRTIRSISLRHVLTLAHPPRMPPAKALHPSARKETTGTPLTSSTSRNSPQPSVLATTGSTTPGRTNRKKQSVPPLSPLACSTVSKRTAGPASAGGALLTGIGTVFATAV